MGQIYEAMVLLDNDVVRTDWRKAKAIVTSTLTKHAATILSARRWEERSLAYPINGKRRATYFIAYCEIPPERFEALRRDLDLNESVMRYLITGVVGMPENEAELAALEDGADFVVPEPPEEEEPPSPFLEYEAAAAADESTSEGDEFEPQDADSRGDDDHSRSRVRRVATASAGREANTNTGAAAGQEG